MIKAFLSHSSDDKQIVREIKKKIGRVWTYFDEDCFQAGEDFREAINNCLEKTNLFVLFASKSSLKSSWVKFEIDESWWQTVSRNNIKILVITLDDISITQLPQWMQKAKFDKVKTSYLASELIKKELFESLSIENRIYIGRENDTDAFYRNIIEYKDQFPNIIAITGLNGIGRRTFIKDILKKRFSLNFTIEFELSDTDGLVELHRKLLDDNIESLDTNSIIEHDNWVSKQSLPEKAKELARVLSTYTRNGSCPILIDDGAMLDDSGFYKNEFITMFEQFSENHPDSYLVLVHTRLPKLSWEHRSLMYRFRLHALTDASSYSLFDALLRRNNVPIQNADQVKEIAEYLEGYPPSILYATRECVLEGIDFVCSDKTSLVDFQAHLFSKYIEKIDLSPIDLDVLTALHNIGSLPIQPLVSILGKSKEEIIISLKKCHDYNIIEVNVNGAYSISPPMRMTVDRKVLRYDKIRFSQIANLLIKEFWKPNTDINFSVIDIIINSILRSGQEHELMQFQKYVLPSHLLKAAEKANQDTDWVLAEKYARKALTLDNHLNDAWVLLFKVLVRQETHKNIKENNIEEDKILDILVNSNDARHYYLQGFRFWKRRKYHEAIDKFLLAKTSGDDSIPTHRDLAECYYQTNQIGNAQQEINSVLKSRKINNPFILDLATKIAIETDDFDYANTLLEKQELVDRHENIEHRRATYYMKMLDYETALLHSTNACNGERVLPQMHLLRMNIAIHLKNYGMVEDEYQYIKKNYKHYSYDTCEILYITMLLYRRGWEAAEARFSKIKKTDSPFARNLRYKIIAEKERDISISQIDKQKLQMEKAKLDTQRLLDILSQLQCYDFQFD